jgi:hypothetical protein
MDAVFPREFQHTAEPLMLIGIIGVREQQGYLHTLRQQFSHAANADFAVGEHHGRGHLRRIRDPPRHDHARHRPIGIAILFQHSLDDVTRPLAHLRVNAPHVFTQQADAEQRQT